MKVLKFGGSSVGNPARIASVISILENYIAKKIEFAVVFSAFQTVTDKLIATANKAFKRDETYLHDLNQVKLIHHEAVQKLISKSITDSTAFKVADLLRELEEVLTGVFLVKELTPRSLDFIMSFGERLSCTIIADAMKSRNIDAEYLDARKIVKTDDSFGSARVNFEKTNLNIVNYFSEHKSIQVITGFIGSTELNETATLGRGGSDYTASIFGAALNSEEIEIWTDVDGILTADPRKVPSAFSLESVTYLEAMELSHFGAKVIYPPTMRPAQLRKIPIRIKNTFNPEHNGTLISGKDTGGEFSVKGITSIDDISLLQISGSGMVGVVGIASRIFSALAKEKINIIMITQASSEHTVCLAVAPQSGERAKAVIEEEFKWEIRDGMIDEVVIEKNLSIIAIVGEDMRHTPGISGKVFKALGSNGVNIIAIAQGSSELNISVVINKNTLTKAMNVLHDSLFFDKQKNINLFVVGTGLVGGAFLDLIATENIYPTDISKAKLNLIGIANIEKMVWDKKGMDPKKWRNLINNSTDKSNIKKFIDIIKEFGFSNSVVVDCTASKIVVENYCDLLLHGISVVTPNKIANSQNFEKYKELRSSAKKGKSQFRYSTNVGAALPIIGSLRELITNGDEIIKIEGVLSGTLSYIFNSLRESSKFSEIVKDAKSKGFTEPDPRDDLNGLDMARKILILMREVGINMNLENVKIEKLISPEAEKAASIDEFFKILQKDDDKFNMMKEEALAEGKTLCYIAKYEKGEASLSIQKIDKNHPFSNLHGSDNIVTFTTKRYSVRPLTIQGPGAGADITASGILSDILRIANSIN